MGSPKKLNDKPIPKIVAKTFKEISKGLVYIGKPFYYFLSLIIIVSVFLFYLLSETIKKLAGLLINLPKLLWKKAFLVPKKLKGVKIKTPTVKLKLPSLPKIKRPSFRGLAVILLILSPFILFWALILKDLPSPRDLVTRDIEVSTKIYDRNGVLLYKIYKDKNRTIVPLEEIPENVKLATLAAEDAEFYAHPGFSIRGMVRATYRNLTREDLSGGSTITQQLVKNALLSSEKTVIRKLREIVLAMQVEVVYSKDEILEMYLNEVSYGGTAYGIQEASRLYFDKDVKDLSLAEATLLAGLPKSPTKYSPFGTSPELGLARQKDIVRLMRVNKFITKEQEQKALNEKLTFAQNTIDIKAPHFVMYVKRLLSEKYGEELVQKGGLEVVTTLDYSIQRLAENVIKNEVESLTRLNVGNGAAVVLNPKSGEILAMVGSKDYFDTAEDGNVNVTTSLRQPGSSIKVVNYAYALENGFTPATIIPDTPITFSVTGQEPYSPKNYDNRFRGNVSLRSALAESRNVPAVKVLATYGVGKMVEMGKKMGITTWEDKSRFGLSLTLGGGEVKLLDLAQVYATVANYGKRPNLTSIVEVRNHNGKLLERNGCIDPTNPPKIKETTANRPGEVKAAEAKSIFSLSKENCKQEKVLDERVSYLLTDILKDNDARAPAFGRFSELVIPSHPEVAVKTGTSNDLRDNLTVGYNQEYLVAAWVGNNDNSPMSRVASGVTGASPIFNSIMSNLLSNKEVIQWQMPDGVVRLGVCSLTGTLPCEGCPTKTELFLEEDKPQMTCNPDQFLAEKEKESREKILPEAARTERGSSIFNF